MGGDEAPSPKIVGREAIARAGVVWTLVAAALALGAGAAIAVDARAGVALAAALPLAAMLVRKPVARLTWFVAGGLVVFQATQDISAPKLVWLGGALVSVAAACVNLHRDREPWMRTLRGLLPASVAVLVVVVGSGFVATGLGTSQTAWARDVLPYALMPLGLPVAIDAARVVSPRGFHAVIAVGGLAAAVGFASDWLDRRGVSALPFGRLLLATTMLAALGFSLALAKVALGPTRRAWTLVAVAIPVVMLTTGTRVLSLFALAALGVIGPRAKARIGVIRLGGLIVPLLLLVALVTPWVAARLSTDPGFFQRRVGAAAAIFAGQAAGDQSLIVRQQAYAWTRHTVSQHLWLGAGPGHVFPNNAFTLDTPLVTPAKFGLVGTAVLLVFLAAVAMVARRSARLDGYRCEHTGIRAFVFVIAGLLPFGSPFEDKGFAFALALAVGMMAAIAREASRPTRVVDRHTLNDLRPTTLPLLPADESNLQACART